MFAPLKNDVRQFRGKNETKAERLPIVFDKNQGPAAISVIDNLLVLPDLPLIP